MKSMEQNTSQENEIRLYQLHWKACLVKLAYEILGDGFYNVHPRKGRNEKKNLYFRECFSILKGYSVNGSVTRETLSRWHTAMASNEVDPLGSAVAKCMTYLEECIERLTNSVPPFWKSSDDELQFFRESDGGLSDKYWCAELFRSSISTMGMHAGLDEYHWPIAGIFDSDAVKQELPRLFGKYWGVFYSAGDDGGEKEEWCIASRLKGSSSDGDDELKPFYYTDGRYTQAPMRVFLNWNSNGKKSFFAWPISSFKERCSTICDDKSLSEDILKNLFDRKDDADEIKNIEDIICPKDFHVRKWTSFEKCFAYYSRGLPGDEFKFTFPDHVLGKDWKEKLSEGQLDRLFLAFLVFQSEMMAAYLLENTRAVLLNCLSAETVESIFDTWRKQLPEKDKLLEPAL